MKRPAELTDMDRGAPFFVVPMYRQGYVDALKTASMSRAMVWGMLGIAWGYAMNDGHPFVVLGECGVALTNALLAYRTMRPVRRADEMDKYGGSPRVSLVSLDTGEVQP